MEKTKQDIRIEDYLYTVAKKKDADLAGLPAKLVMQFLDGSCIEVSPEEVVEIRGEIRQWKK